MSINNQCTDHLGNVFKSERQRAKYWGLPANTIKYRLDDGQSLEEALTTPLYYNTSGNQCTDHLGNVFKSEREMYKAWNIPVKVGQARKTSGWSVEKILTTPVEKTYTDHMGNKFKCEKEMYEYWNISEGVGQARKTLGWPIEKILTTPVEKTYTDHIGNVFNTEREMYKAWNIPEKVGQNRKSLGWSVEQILTTPVGVHIKKYEDPITNNLYTLNEFSENYGIKTNVIEKRIKYGYTVSQSIDISIRIPKNIISNINKSKYNLTVHKRITKDKDVFECYIDNGNGTSIFKIMTYEMIDQYCLEQYKKLHNID